MSLRLCRAALATAVACCLFLPGAGGSQDAPVREEPAATGLLRIRRGKGLLPLLIARDEELTFNVRVRLPLLGSPKLGTVVLRSQVVPHRASALVKDSAGEASGERAELSAHAKGGNFAYQLEELRKTQIMPQKWPRMVHRSTQTGTENRRREQFMGVGPDGLYTRFRADGHCWGCEQPQHFIESAWAWQDPRHCDGCKRGEHRVWRDWKERPIPEGTVDMVTAVTLGRSMLLQNVDEVRFPLIDEEELWDVTVRRGQTRRLEVDAGKFDASEILLETQPAEGEDASPEDFKGLFGIHGTVSIWFDTKTGVPVLISGSIPLGSLITLNAEVQLASYRGTPDGFAPVP